MHATTPEFGVLLRHWREARRFSQLDLALQAEVSSKHVSFLETGRNHPSREMILRLSQAMDIPLRDRNALLNAAGFAAAYRESTSGAPAVEQAEEALARILAKQEPYPAIVLDADWELLRRNEGARALAEFLLPGSSAGTGNALEMLFAAEGLMPFVGNWEQLAPVLLMRLWRETLQPGCSEQRRQLFRRLDAMPTTPTNWRELAGSLPTGPTIDLVLEKDGVRFAFFTTVTTFGTPQDVMLQELRMESYFPSDDATRELCRSWAT
ncbi:MAG: helix-turn-helix transcriptional regulator [Gammaproteobacteria bacterium]|nr:helix-turn-helix transcriptional regulator [Gammaproteobacteria bacterium]